MKIYDSHMHSHHSHDASKAVECLAQTAKQLQFSGITVTDHADIAWFKNADKINNILDLKNEINSIKNTGLLIESVSNDSDLYGKVDKGDIITHINGTKITTDDMVLDIIEKCKAGDKITVSVITDDGASLTLNVQLKANVGESSYTIKNVTPNSGDNSQSSGGTFDFPFGE